MMIETERLNILPMQQSDSPALLRLSMDFEHSPLANYDSPFPLDPAANQRLTEFLASTGLYFAVCRKDTAVKTAVFAVFFYRFIKGFLCADTDVNGKGITARK